MSVKIVTRTPEEVGIWIAENLAGCTDEERVRVFETIWDYYCQHCGREQGPKLMRCRCWDDS